MTYTDAWLASFHRDPPADPDTDDWEDNDDEDDSRATAERLTGHVVAGPGS